MPALRVFVSSTCYDLKRVRERLRSFIENLGHEPVMSDYGGVFYDPRKHTHPSCVAGVKNCDMLVLLVGGRFGGTAVSEALSMIDFEALKKKIKSGTEIDPEKLSITQLEVLAAIENEIPVYAFIKEDVLDEHKWYEKIKDKVDIDTISFSSIEKPGTAKYIFEFINIIRLRPYGNSIFPFNSENDIEDTLKKQWSSLFQELLKERFANAEKTNTDRNEEKATTSALEKKVNDLEKIVQSFIDRVQTDGIMPVSTQKKHRKILWVDDHPEGNRAVMNYFEDQGIHFDIALTTAAGLEFYKKISYDLVITDMGRRNESDAGVRLIKELKQLHCQVPIIVYSCQSSIRKHIDEVTSLGSYKVTNSRADVISFISSIYGPPN